MARFDRRSLLAMAGLGLAAGVIEPRWLMPRGAAEAACSAVGRLRKRRGKWEYGRLELRPESVTLHGGKRPKEHDLSRLAELECAVRGTPIADFEEEWKARSKRPPRSAAGWAELGDWCRRHGLEDRAIEAYREALDRDEDRISARHALGWLRREGQWVAADDALRRATASGRGSLLELAEELHGARMHTWEIRALAAMLLGAPRDTEAIELWLTRLRVGYAPTLPLGPPIAGRFWAVPDVTRHHAAHASSAFALDLAALNEEGRVHEGNGDKNEDYASWDAPLLAVANGRIVRARDDLADDAAYRGVADPARANDLVLQVEGGQAFYQHLKQGSLRAKAGDEVQRGQELARVGNSGNGSYPHLHFALYEEFEAAGKRGWISVPVAVEAVHVVGLLDAKEGKPRDVDLRCRHAPLQESWVVEAG